MALTLASQSSRVPLSPAKQLNEAVDDFQRILTEDQRTELKNIKSIPDADAVLVFTAQLDSSQHRRGRSIATRLHSVLQSVREFSAIIDTFVSSNPEIAALVWGSVKLTIQVRCAKMVETAQLLTFRPASALSTNLQHGKLFAPRPRRYPRLHCGKARESLAKSVFENFYGADVVHPTPATTPLPNLSDYPTTSRLTRVPIRTNCLPRSIIYNSS